MSAEHNRPFDAWVQSMARDESAIRLTEAPAAIILQKNPPDEFFETLARSFGKAFCPAQDLVCMWWFRKKQALVLGTLMTAERFVDDCQRRFPSRSGSLRVWCIAGVAWIDPWRHLRRADTG